MQRQGNFGGQEVADEYADCVGDPLADFPAILWIQARPPPPAQFPASPLSPLPRSPNFALEPQVHAFFVTGFNF